MVKKKKKKKPSLAYRFGLHGVLQSKWLDLSISEDNLKGSKLKKDKELLKVIRKRRREVEREMVDIEQQRARHTARRLAKKEFR